MDPDFADAETCKTSCLATREEKVQEINNRINDMLADNCGGKKPPSSWEDQNEQHEYDHHCWGQLVKARRLESEFRFADALKVYRSLLKDFPSFMEAALMQEECDKKFRAAFVEVTDCMKRSMIRAANIDMEASYARDREYTNQVRKRMFEETGEIVEPIIPLSERRYGTMESVLTKLKEMYNRLKRKEIIDFSFSDAFFDPGDDTERKRVKREYEAKYGSLDEDCG
uniref:Uncharacterized protein n=1 Tax=Cyclophora tenuis TaxID=216820 RepID=A0A7S1D1Z4_CYCTE